MKINLALIMNKYSIYFVSVFLFLISAQVSAIDNQLEYQLDYKLPDVDGNIQSLGQYRGKWVVVNYWATWCASCVKELPDLAELHEQNKDSNIVVVGVNYESISPEQLKGFVKAYDIPYPVWRSEEHPVTPLGKVPALPTTYIIDPEGIAIAGEVGVMTKQKLEEFIARKMRLEKYAKYSIKQDS